MQRNYDKQRIPVVQAIPRAPYSWESRAILLGSRQESGRIRMPFNRPIVICGCHVSVSDVLPPGQGDVSETPEDVDILLELDRGERFTSMNTDTGVTPGEFCTLAALDQVRAGRYLDLVLDYAAPVLQITYRHQRDVSQWSFADALVKVTWFAQYLE